MWPAGCPSKGVPAPPPWEPVRVQATSRWRRAARLAAAAAVVSALAACSLVDAGTGRGTVTVSALWFGTAEDGSDVYGTTPVQITASRTRGDGYTVDLQSFADAGAGRTWDASAWTAATVAMLADGEDPRGRRITFGLDESIDGPSASALLSVGVLASLDRSAPAADASLTGMVMPNGSIGAVSGVPDKLRAAARAGLTTVLIPDGTDRGVDPQTGDTVDLREFGGSLGLNVIPVATITEAAAIMGGQPLPVPTYSRPEVDPTLLELLTTETGRVLVRVRRLRGELQPPVAPGAAAERKRLLADSRATLRSVPRLLARGDAFVAFSQATLLESDMQQYNARQRSYTLAGRIGPRRLADRLVARAAALVAGAREQIELQSGRPLQFLEQYPAMGDALTWATGSLAIIDAAAARAQSQPPTAGGLADVAAELQRAQYRLDVYLPIQVGAVTTIGKIPATDPPQTLSLLSSYADLLGQSADAVMEYHDSLQADAEVLRRLQERATEQQRLWRAHESDAGQSGVLQRLALGLSYYVASSYLFTLGPLLAPVDRSGRGVLLDPGYFGDQVNIATTQNHRISTSVADEGMDPSYVVWGNEWGLALADEAAGVPIPDEERGRGLTYQWYASIQGNMLTAAATTTDSAAAAAASAGESD